MTYELDSSAELYADFTVGNTPGTPLPHTGGRGTRIFTFLGGVLILGATILLIRRRRPFA